MGDLGLRDWIFHIVNEACAPPRFREVQNLPFAQELLRQVGFKVLDFEHQRAHQVGLLNALLVHQFVLAELKYKAMIQAQWQNADHKECAKNEPENAHVPCAQAFPEGPRRLRGGRHLH